MQLLASIVMSCLFATMTTGCALPRTETKLRARSPRAKAEPIRFSSTKGMRIGQKAVYIDRRYPEQIFAGTITDIDRNYGWLLKIDGILVWAGNVVDIKD